MEPHHQKAQNATKAGADDKGGNKHASGHHGAKCYQCQEELADSGNEQHVHVVVHAAGLAQRANQRARVLRVNFVIRAVLKEQLQQVGLSASQVDVWVAAQKSQTGNEHHFGDTVSLKECKVAGSEFGNGQI